MKTDNKKEEEVRKKIVELQKQHKNCIVNFNKETNSFIIIKNG